jgi:hypothetical protein
MDADSPVLLGLLLAVLFAALALMGKKPPGGGPKP